MSLNNNYINQKINFLLNSIARLKLSDGKGLYNVMDAIDQMAEILGLGECSKCNDFFLINDLIVNENSYYCKTCSDLLI